MVMLYVNLKIILVYVKHYIKLYIGGIIKVKDFRSIKKFIIIYSKNNRN